MMITEVSLMTVTVVSPYETSAMSFFNAIKAAKADIVIDVRLRATNQLCGFSKDSDLAYFVPEILKVPYVHDSRFAPSTELLAKYLSGQDDFKRYADGYLQEMKTKHSKTLFEASYGGYS